MLVELITANLVPLSVAIVTAPKYYFTEVFGKRKGSVIAWRQHHAVKKLLNWETVTDSEISSGAPDVSSNLANFDLGCFYV